MPELKKCINWSNTTRITSEPPHVFQIVPPRKIQRKSLSFRVKRSQPATDVQLGHAHTSGTHKTKQCFGCNGNWQKLEVGLIMIKDVYKIDLRQKNKMFIKTLARGLLQRNTCVRMGLAYPWFFLGSVSFLAPTKTYFVKLIARYRFAPQVQVSAIFCYSVIQLLLTYRSFCKNVTTRGPLQIKGCKKQLIHNIQN